MATATEITPGGGWPGAPGADHAHGHHGALAHHFDDIEQQHGAARLGMWMFLGTEVLFFGGVFAAYTAYRMWYPADFHAGSSKLNVWIAGINSFLLLTSSLTITLAIGAAQAGKKKSLEMLLGVTILLALAFLGFKTREYYNDYREGLTPGPNFNTEEFVQKDSHGHPLLDANGNPKPIEVNIGAEKPVPVNIGRVQIFYMFYYSMTGLHVLHMVVGVGIIGWLFVISKLGHLTPDRYMSVEITSLYWHFVDLAWLFLMPLLYLAGSHAGQHFHL